uniref:Uncharacterized protein n=1 Tax=Oryza punctata TaxID=4537 RepID=A0A0E0KHE3_ORYPU
MRARSSGGGDLYVRGAKGFGKFIVAANPRAGVDRRTSRVFGIGEPNSEQEVRELVRAMQTRRGAAADTGAGGKKAETGAPALWRGTAPLGRIVEDVRRPRASHQGRTQDIYQTGISPPRHAELRIQGRMPIALCRVSLSRPEEKKPVAMIMD